MNLINTYEDTGKILLPGWLKKQLSLEVIKDFEDSLKKTMDVGGEEILTMILEKAIESEFGEKINHVNYPNNMVQVTLELNETDNISFTKEKGEIPVIQSSAMLQKDAVFFDGPYLLDELSERTRTTWFFNRFSHKADLWDKFSSDEGQESVINSILGEKSWKELESLLDEMCGGSIVVDSNAGYQYISSSLMEPLGIDSLSMGLKSILSLKMLLENGRMNNTSVLIFDEPEIHLHPEWQFYLARIMVMLPKVLNVRILLSTHSADFLSAIDYYTSEYNMKDITRYYLMQKKGDCSVVEDVSNQVDLVYQELSTPFLTVAEKL